MAYLVGVLVLVVGAGLSFALHEVGHMLPAKRFGIRCTQYMIGFGPTLWSITRGETEYGIKALPFGGYVRMLGMFPPRNGAPARADTTGRLSLMVEQARHEALREVGPEDAERLFYQRSVPKRLVIMLGGPTMNLLIGVALLTVIVSGFGLPALATTVQSVSRCVIPVTEPATRTCTASDPQAPAAKAGMQPGDKIVAFGGQEITSWEQLRGAIRANTGTPVTVVVEREGKRVTLTATPLVDQRPVLDANGDPVSGPDGKPKLTMVGFLGVTPASELVPQPLSAVPPMVGDVVGKVTSVVFHLPQKMVGVAKAAFGSGTRDPNSPVSIVGVGRFAGEIGSAKGSATAPISLSDRIVGWLSLLVSLNMALFVFNMIPLLPLDGGHVAGALWEGLRRRVARLRRLPDPGPVDVARALPLAYGVLSVFVLMSGLLIYADIVRPVSLGG